MNQPSYPTKYKVGDIISKNPNVNIYWKIYSIYCNPLNSLRDTYNVIKCSKHGKEYSDKNGYYIHSVDKNPAWNLIQNVQHQEVVKKSKVGPLKNHINQTKLKIEYLIKDLAKSEAELELLLKNKQ